MDKNFGKISLGINVVVIICLIFVFVKLGGSNDEAEVSPAVNNKPIVDNTNLKTTPSTANIVYVNTDTIISQYVYAKELMTGMQEEMARLESRYMQKQREFQKWQEKWAKLGQLTSTEQAKAQKEAEGWQIKMANLEQEIQQKSAEVQGNATNTVTLRVQNYCEQYAQQNGYDYILSYSMMSPIFVYGNNSLDVTAQVVAGLNQEFMSNNPVSIEDTESTLPVE